MKKILLGIIIGGIIFGGIVYATSYKASDVSYSNDKTTATNVHDALDDLYNMKNVETKTITQTYTCNTSTTCTTTISNDVIFENNIKNVYISDISTSHTSYQYELESLTLNNNVATVVSNVSIGGSKTCTIEITLVGIY